VATGSAFLFLLVQDEEAKEGHPNLSHPTAGCPHRGIFSSCAHAVRHTARWKIPCLVASHGAPG